MSAAMATRDATSKDKDPGAAAESGNGAESPSDVPGGEEIGFGEVKHGLPDAKTCRTVLSKMMLIRRFEERAGEMYAKAKIGGFLHLCIGEEATIVGATQALNESDYLMSTYREHGQALARGTDPNAVMAELFGREGGVSKGRGGSMHLFDWERRFLGGYGIVGGSLPLSAGVALACDYLETEDAILSMMGDGATNQGTFGETMNLAALWKLPVVFLIINNQFGMGTALHRHSAVTDLSLKSEGFGVPGTRCDGMDVLDVHAVVTESLKCARDERKPQLVEAVTYRYRGHSMADPEEYRSKEEVEEWRERDPIKAFAKRLVDEGVLEEDEVEQMDEEAIERVDEAQRFADESPFPDLDSLYDDVYVFSDEVPTWWTVDERSPEVHRGEREREAGEIPHELAEKGAAYAGVGDHDARKRPAPKDQDEEGEQQGPGEAEEEADAEEAEASGEGSDQEAVAETSGDDAEDEDGGESAEDEAEASAEEDESAEEAGGQEAEAGDETEASAQEAEAETEQGEEEEGQEDEAKQDEASAEASGTGEPEADERDETGGGG
jgi:pyruvate dehydrogenase E1 component alpha subunit